MAKVNNAKSLLRLFWQPAAAMGAILDQGSLLFASMAVLVVSLLSPVQVSFYAPLLVLAVFYVPGVLLLSILFARLGGGVGNAFQRDYSPLLTCTAMAWTAANIPLVLGVRILPASVWTIFASLALGYFLVLMFFAVRTVFGTENWIAAVVVGLSWIPLLAAAFLWGPLHFLLGWIASPFFLFYAYYYLGGELRKSGRRHAQPAELSANAGSRGHQSA